MSTLPRLFLSLFWIPSALCGAALETLPGLKDVRWEEVSEGDGIVVYRAEVAGSPLVAFRARTEMPASLYKTAGVLIDIERRHEWMPTLRATRLVRKISELERIEYSHFHTPPFTAERDFVMRCRADIDVADRTVVLWLESTEDPSEPPREGLVRGELLTSGYRFHERGNVTEVEFWTHLDPKGSIAKWIVNAFAKSFPRKMLEAIRDRSLRADVAEHAELRAYFEKHEKTKPKIQ